MIVGGRARVVVDVLDMEGSEIEPRSIKTCSACSKVPEVICCASTMGRNRALMSTGLKRAIVVPRIAEADATQTAAINIGLHLFAQPQRRRSGAGHERSEWPVPSERLVVPPLPRVELNSDTTGTSVRLVSESFP